MMRRTPLARTGGPRRRTSLPARSQRQADRDAVIDDAIRQAKERDGYRCQAEARGVVTDVTCWGGAEGQHIIPRSVRKDLAADVDNIVTLCSGHHRWVDAHPNAARALGFHGWSTDRPMPTWYT